MSLARRIGRAIFLGQAGRLMEAGAMFLLSLLLARVLGPADYGVYALGISLAGFCGFISLIGLGPETLGKFIPELAANGQRRQAMSFLRKLLRIKGLGIVVVACGVFSLRNMISARLHAPFVAVSFAAVILVFAARGVLDLFTFFFSSLLELRRVVIAKTTAGLISPALFLFLFELRHGTVGAAWLSIAAGSFAGILILAYPLFLVNSDVLPEEPQLSIRRVIAFGAFAWATNFFVYVLSDSTDVLLLGTLTTDRAAIGRYAAGARIVFSLTSLLLGWASLLGVASLSESYQSAGREGLRRAVESVWKFGVFALVPPLIFVLRFARPIVTILFSAAYGSAAIIVQILAGLLICGAFCGFSIHGGILYVLNKERLACGIVGFAAAFNVVSEVLLVRHLGVEGAAWATGASFLLLAAWCHAASKRYVEMQVPIEFFFKTGLAAGIGLLVTAWLQPETLLQLLGAGTLYVIAFFVALMLFKPLTIIDSASLSRINSALGGWANRFFTAAYASPQSGDR